MSSERLILAATSSSSQSFRSYSAPELPPPRIFDELPKATVVSVSRPDANNISPLQLSYTIHLQYKQFNWHLLKQASQVIYLHFSLKKRAILEELHEKQEQVKEWLHNIGIGDQTAAVNDIVEPDDGFVSVPHEDGVKNRHIPSRAALPIIHPALGAQKSISENAKVAMQGYLNHFLGNINIVNSREVCKFLEVSKLSFLQEYGPKMKEGYVMVKHLARVSKGDECHICCWFGCCNTSWQKVWAVLKPGFLALLEDPFDTNLLDIIIFDVLPASDKDGKDQVHLAEEIKERNPLRHSFKVSCGDRSIKFRTTNNTKVKVWVSAINNASQKPPKGWSHPHRFGSFAPPRGFIEDGSQAQWFIDGQAAFEAIASSIEKAKSEIYICGWWICPELYLRRPFHSHGSSRLDALLEAKAKQGVQIYILLYKEVSLALKINSSYSKKRLLDIHKNVKVLRYPDHFSTGVYFWSHHEKLVIIDYQICFIGGLDLCFGRYDTTKHKVGDCPPLIWPGKDYYNPRESEPNSWEDTMKDELEREKYPRMPWHDVHCALWGPACRDIARHFVQRWNHAKRNKAPNEQAIPLLMPHHHMVLPHYMGRNREINIESDREVLQKGISRQDSLPCQSPVEDIPVLLPHEADELDTSYLNDQLIRPGKNQYQHQFDLLTEIDESISFPFQRSNKGESSIPDRQMKGTADDLNFMDLQREMNLDVAPKPGMQISNDWWEKQERGYQNVLDKTAPVGPRTPCYCQNQFFVSGLSGDESIQNRLLEVLYRRILLAHKEQKCFRVVVVIPLLPGFQGGVDDGGAATVRAVMHWHYRTICRGKNSILYNLNQLLGSKVDDYISFYGLRTYGALSDAGPVVTSQVYVHSKVMIVDDCAALIGSCNINDRSLLGSRDSEIAVVIEDKEFIKSSMNGECWDAGKFTLSLRISLWAEHLGLHVGEISQIRDPIAESTYKDLWMATAKKNTRIYQDVFGCVPNDQISSRSELRQSMSYWKEKIGHTTIDLGVAPKELEIIEDGETKVMDPMEKLKSVRGYLVSYPLEFMSQEDLRPMFAETEFYTSPQVFH
ncbi:phospholipase D zeta 1-like isoform X2 [Diospyros lotus]|uniref:phospholipase D zeta 1-like isoform X2 n=1 Tax=Diospyros lotus TaxID=55363 RepID=UPI00225858EC|nr:phospholipase D zeta 1-like isoform X2 [Diospyros lotus]